ncbi:hypothetical protein ABGB18_13875 [Nonomuraea sp. B12E4]|uniref:hypothetical protein n=1 Tax=Nonomuraea sp. B12E4 TaxID=3153564 RepID=UPI00325D1AF9
MVISDARTRILDAAEELFAGGGYAATPIAVKERLGRLNGELVARARFALGLALPGARGDAARLEVAAAMFAAVLIYQENLCQLTGHQIDPDAVAELIAHALV